MAITKIQLEKGESGQCHGLSDQTYSFGTCRWWNPQAPDVLFTLVACTLKICLFGNYICTWAQPSPCKILNLLASCQVNNKHTWPFSFRLFFTFISPNFTFSNWILKLFSAYIFTSGTQSENFQCFSPSNPTYFANSTLEHLKGCFKQST